jgi:hypothetical protein
MHRQPRGLVVPLHRTRQHSSIGALGHYVDFDLLTIAVQSLPVPALSDRWKPRRPEHMDMLLSSGAG